MAFSATGGSGTGFMYTVSTSRSGGSIIPTTGAYVAGGVGGVTDVVTVTDSLGNTATSNVTVTVPVVPDAGADAGDAGRDAAPGDGGADASTAPDAAAADASPGIDSGAIPGADAGSTPAGDSGLAPVADAEASGCGCRATESNGTAGAAWVGLLGALALVRRRHARRAS